MCGWLVSCSVYTALCKSDDVSLHNSKWTAIYCPNNTICGYSTYASLDAGDHRIYHKNKAATIGIVAYGFGVDVSYGFPAGFQIGGVQGMLLFSVISMLKTGEMTAI